MGTCDACGNDTDNDAIVMCDHCDEEAQSVDDALLAAARAEGSAQGRADEREDVLAFLDEQVSLGVRAAEIVRKLRGRLLVKRGMRAGPAKKEGA